MCSFMPRQLRKSKENSSDSASRLRQNDAELTKINADLAAAKGEAKALLERIHSAGKVKEKSHKKVNKEESAIACSVQIDFNTYTAC